MSQSYDTVIWYIVLFRQKNTYRPLRQRGAQLYETWAKTVGYDFTRLDKKLSEARKKVFTAWPIRPADEIYNAKVSGASSPEQPKEASPTKTLLPSSQFHLSFGTGPIQITLVHFHYGEERNGNQNPARFSGSKSSSYFGLLQI